MFDPFSGKSACIAHHATGLQGGLGLVISLKALLELLRILHEAYTVKTPLY